MSLAKAPLPPSLPVYETPKPRPAAALPKGMVVSVPKIIKSNNKTPKTPKRK